jgi:hypothetical protein
MSSTSPDSLEAANDPNTRPSADANDDDYSFVGQVALNRLPTLRENLAKLNRKAGKCGAAPFKMVLGRKGEEFVEDRSEGRSAHIQWVEVTLTGKVFALGDYKIRAVIDHRHETCTAVGNFKVPTRYIGCEPDCDHCKTKRDRAKTFILQDSVGSLSAVGKSCLEDFTGHAPEHALAATSIYDEFRAQMAELQDDEGGRRSPSFEPALPTLPFLAVISNLIRTQGWVSKPVAKANREYLKEPSESTADAAIRLLAKLRLPHDRITLDSVDVADEDRELAVAALRYARAKYAELLDQDTVEAFDASMRSVTLRDSFITKHSGLAAYALRMYLREVVEPSKQLKAREASEYIGVVKKREEFTLTVHRLVPISGAFNNSMLHLCTDAGGNQVTWRNSGSREADLETGRSYVVKANFKKHDE